jgi:hypothetical protein
MSELLTHKGHQLSIRADGDAFQAVVGYNIIPGGNVPGKPYLFVTREDAIAAAQAYIDHAIAYRNEKKFRGCTNVHEYFEKRIGTYPEEASLKDLPCDSNCGKECVAAIDAACKFLKHVEDAMGKGHTSTFPIIDALNETIAVYWLG